MSAASAFPLRGPLQLPVIADLIDCSATTLRRTAIVIIFERITFSHVFANCTRDHHHHHHHHHRLLRQKAAAHNMR